MQNFYDILGVQHNATDQEIRDAYIRLIREVHPDLNQGNAQSTRRSQSINAAYTALKDEGRRREYDSWLADQDRQAAHINQEQRSNNRNTSADRPESEYESQPPKFKCQGCGRSDVFLKCYVFIWVLSLLVITNRGNDALILCRKCRFRTSLVYVLRVGLLGWWGIPWGIVYTFAAIIQNSTGGICPKDVNERLLASHGYMLYTQGNYSEALDSIQESQRILPKREKTEFVEELRKLIIPLPRYQALVHTVSRLNPAWVILPMLTVLVLVSMTLLSNIDSGYHKQYVEASINGDSNTPVPETDQLDAAAKQDGFDLQKFQSTLTDCNATISQAASYIHQNVPMVGTHDEGTTTIHDYVLDRHKLSAAELDTYAESLRTNLSNGTTQVNSLMLDSSSRKNDLAKYLSQQIDFMRSCYFNVGILAISVHHTEAGNTFSDLAKVSQSVTDLEHDDLLKGWVTKSGQGNHLSKVIRCIAQEQQVLHLKDGITTKQAKLDETNQAIKKLRDDLNLLQASGDITNYNIQVPQFNQLINASRSINKSIEADINNYNVLIADLNKNSPNDAFDDCIDSRILLTSFDEVDLKHKSQPPN